MTMTGAVTLHSGRISIFNHRCFKTRKTDQTCSFLFEMCEYVHGKMDYFFFYSGLLCTVHLWWETFEFLKAPPCFFIEYVVVVELEIHTTIQEYKISFRFHFIAFKKKITPYRKPLNCPKFPALCCRWSASNSFF